MVRQMPLPDELLGRRLFGEGLDDAGLAAWFADERNGYFGIVGDGSNRDDAMRGTGACNQRHIFRHLPPGRFSCCLALGAANGREYAGLAERVDHFVAIEPGRAFWHRTIAGVPADYRTPTLRGKIDLPDGACDLAGSFGVLHHIPNVSEVLAELARVLAPGAPLMIREPIISLGDFRQPRLGLTRNERGIPHAVMDAMLQDAGFRIDAKSFIRFPLLHPVARSLGMDAPWESKAFVGLDTVLSQLMAWNIRYWRPQLWQKIAPTMAYWLAVKV